MKLIRLMLNALKFVIAGVIGFVRLNAFNSFFNIFKTRRKLNE